MFRGFHRLSAQPLARYCLKQALLLGMLVAPATLHAAPTLQPIVLQLQWNHQFQFAGYYAAQMMGYYEAAGLDVTIKDGGYDDQGHAVQPEVEVLFGRANFGSTRTDLLINRSHGLPLVVLANIMQHSPLVLMTLERYGFEHLQDIGYQRPVSLSISTDGNSRMDAEAVAALRLAQVDIKRLNNRPPSWKLGDLYAGFTELTPAYSTDQSYFVRRDGEIPVMIKPIDYGIDFYGDLLFTSEYMLEKQPHTVSAFREASLRGWLYALNNPEAVIDYLLSHYRTRGPRYDRDFMLYEAEQTRHLINPEVIEIGYINPNRWQRIADIYHQLGLIDSANLDLEHFLYHPQSQSFWHRYQFWLLSGLLLFAITISIAAYFSILTFSLKREITRRMQAEKQLEKMAHLDGLTGIDNRHVFEHNLEREFLSAQRQQIPLALLIIDLDNFKQINDHYGHLAGDEVLKSFVTTTQQQLRGSDHFARFGGEEFVVLMPNTLLSEANAIGQRILNAIRSHPVVIEHQYIAYTASIGATAFEADDSHAEAMLKRADIMLYRAKDAGKDRIVATSL